MGALKEEDDHPQPARGSNTSKAVVSKAVVPEPDRITLKKQKAVLVKVEKRTDLHKAFDQASKTAKVLGCSSLKNVVQDLVSEIERGQKVEFVVEGKTSGDTLHLTFQSNAGSKTTVLGTASKRELELNAEAHKALHELGMM